MMKTRLLRIVGIVLAVGALLVVALALAVRVLVDAETVASALSAQASSALDRPVSIGKLGARAWPRPQLRLTGVTVGGAAPVRIGEARLETGLSGLLRGRVEDAELIIIEPVVTAPRAATDSEPPAPATQSDPGLEESSFTVASVRRIEVREGRVEGLPVDVTAELHASLRSTRAEIGHLSLSVGTSRLRVQGVVTNLITREATLDVSSPHLDLDELAATASELPPRSPSGGQADAAVIPLKLKGQLALDAVQARGREIRNVEGDYQVSDSEITLSVERAAFAKGQLKGSTSLTLAPRGIEVHSPL